MKTKPSCFVFITFLFIILSMISACENSRPKCISPAKVFSEKDLVGTWVAGLPQDSDTLIIESNGTYRQIVHIEERQDYESGPNRWWLEFNENNIPYLHLEGMSLCGYNTDISCNEKGGTVYNYCPNAPKQSSDEVILIILGIKKTPLDLLFNGNKKIDFHLFYPSLDNGWFYYPKQ